MRHHGVPLKRAIVIVALLLVPALVVAGGLARDGMPGIGGRGTRASETAAFVNNRSTLFDASNDQLVVPTGAMTAYDGDPSTREITVSGWFNSTDTTLPSAQEMFSRANNPNTEAQYRVVIQQDTGDAQGGSLYMYVGGVNGFYGAAGVMSSGAWHHFALVIKDVAGTKKQRLYLDGAQLGVDANAGTATTAIRWIIGNAGFGNANFGGKLDEFSVWNVGFTVTEVGELRAGGKPGNLRVHSRASALTNWWRMGDGPGDVYPTIKDQVGTADATMTNMTSAAVNFVADVP